LARIGVFVAPTPTHFVFVDVERRAITRVRSAGPSRVSGREAVRNPLRRCFIDLAMFAPF
jgi:hypothetical protein